MSISNAPGILVVDDNKENRFLIAEFLEDIGIPVDEAESGEKCLKMLKEKSYTLVIMDIQMPGLNGFEVLDIMRKDENLYEIPVMFVSTIYDSDQHILKGISSGAIDFIAKPINFQILKSKVLNFIRLYERQARLNEAVIDLELVNKRLKANERKIRDITNSASDSIILLDSDYKITFWNNSSAEIFEYPNEEIICKNFFELLIDHTSREILTHKINHLIKSPDKILRNSFRLNGVKKSGTIFPIDLSLSYFIDEGNQKNYTIIIRDITHNLEIEEQALKSKELQETNKMMKDFINNVSHELRTPMNAILGISNMMLKYNADNLHQKQIEGLQIINQSGVRLLDMINDVLDVAKLEAGKVTIEKEEVDLENLLASVRSMVISLIDKKEIRFIILKSPHIPKVIISDSKKLNQILLNLLSNAVKFTQKGKIHLFIHLKGDHIIFEVTDTGIGISKENQSIIFDKFRQIDNSESKEYKGTGLGLHITKSYVELMGGEISITSLPSKGTTVSFYLPFEETKSKTDFPGEKPSKENIWQISEEINLHQPLVIIIDDNKQNLFWYSELLKDYNYTVFTYNDSNYGLMAIKQYLPDLVLLKFEMPKMHGQFIIDQIGENEALKFIQLIIFTSVEKLSLQNISNPYYILNVPYSTNDLIRKLDKIRINQLNRTDYDYIYLYRQLEYFKRHFKSDQCFHFQSFTSAMMIISRRRVKELIIDYNENNIDYSNLFNWLNNNPELLPEKITFIKMPGSESNAFEVEYEISNLPLKIKSISDIYTIDEAIKKFKNNT